jgi:hypothetical protein
MACVCVCGGGGYCGFPNLDLVVEVDIIFIIRGLRSVGGGGGG